MTAFKMKVGSLCETNIGLSSQKKKRRLVEQPSLFIFPILIFFLCAPIPRLLVEGTCSTQLFKVNLETLSNGFGFPPHPFFRFCVLNKLAASAKSCCAQKPESFLFCFSGVSIYFFIFYPLSRQPCQTFKIASSSNRPLKKLIWGIKSDLLLFHFLMDK